MGLLRLLLLVALVGVVCAVSAGTAPRRPYRCFRPFSALTSFSAGAMRSKDNCRFGPVHVDRAHAAVRCGPLPSDGCTLNVSFGAALEHPAEGDDLRYTLQITAVGGKSIHYKGFDGRGFSACCTLMDESTCQWQGEPGHKAQRVEACALHRTAGSAVSGSVERPLLTITPGAWKAALHFYSGVVGKDTALGTLTVPFELTEADITLEPAHGDPEPEPGTDVAAVVLPDGNSTA